MTNDPFNLQRFVEAQNSVYGQVCAELSAGEKRSHWMWFIFPQIRGLGRSGMAERYAISSLDEAKAYLAHQVLGPRLVECTGLVTGVGARTAADIFGWPDDMKFRSSMTLFAACGDESTIFQKALRKYFDGQPDGRTLELLGVS